MRRAVILIMRSFAVRNIILGLNVFLRWIVVLAGKIQFVMEWGTWPTPEWFDHNLDRFFLWGRSAGNCYWLERGVFSNLAISTGASVLELCCGDGFNAKHFYSYRAGSIISCDFDDKAIQHAKKFNVADNVEFRVADIRTQMPEGIFDNIVWDAAIEHFTPQEIDSIMQNLKNRLSENGILSGYTIVERPDGKSLEQHEYEFKDKADLKRFLSPYFKNVMVFETVYADRHNLYFYASDAVIPFDSKWQSMDYNA